MKFSSRIFGFTVIEILIVAAIIAVLAAIALPNFQICEIRAKVSKTKADMRAMRIALEAYHVDWKEYAVDTANEDYSWSLLTTPVAYMATIPHTQFVDNSAYWYNWYRYYSGGATNTHNDLLYGRYLRQHAYAIDCAGPSLRSSFSCFYVWQLQNGTITFQELPQLWQVLYDPSNGTVSYGDFVTTYKKIYN